MINMKKILVVGYGSIGKRHIENLLSISNLEVIVCTKRKDIGKLKKQMEYANKIQSPCVIFYGDDEEKKAEVKLRNLKTGEELSVKIENLINEIKKII